MILHSSGIVSGGQLLQVLSIDDKIGNHLQPALLVVGQGYPQQVSAISSLFCPPLMMSRVPESCCQINFRVSVTLHDTLKQTLELKSVAYCTC